MDRLTNHNFVRSVSNVATLEESAAEDRNWDYLAPHSGIYCTCTYITFI